MAIYKLPASGLIDKQFVEVTGPDGIVTGYQYDQQTNSLYAKESQVVIPSFHGQTHIAADPIPGATQTLPGLLSAEDKIKLDALTQTRLGVAGFSGAGFVDDNGWLQGDIILAAGTEFISIERIGNVIRFTVDSPTPLSCNQEACAQIFWVQDESDTSAIRPPSCAGKLPGVNSYGELKIFLMPESSIVNPASPLTTLNKKGSYPALVFKRYDNQITPASASFDLILQRNSNGTSKVGWTMVPGSSGTPQSVWFMGADNDGKQIRFDLDIKKEPQLLGQLLYQGHSITKQMGVIVDYTTTVVSTNQYQVKFWSVNSKVAVGASFVATNVWRYSNPTNSPLALTNPQALVLDATSDVLPIGTLIELWEFKTGEINSTRLTAYYFSKEPPLNPAAIWPLSDAITFGDRLTSRSELNTQDAYLSPTVGSGSDLTAHEQTLSDIRLSERGMWGMTGYDDPLMAADDGISTSGGTIVRSDSVSSIAAGTLLTAPVDSEPNPNYVITAKAALLGGAFAFVVNSLVGRLIKWTSGTLSASEHLILENSASKIVVQGEAPGVVEDDTFDIYQPNVTGEPSGVSINNQYIATIDTTLPGLRVVETSPTSDRERPVYLWHRQNHKNVYIKASVGQPASSRFPPVDILLRAPVDSFEERYVKVLRRGQFTQGPFSGMNFMTAKGAEWRDLPRSGSLRILTGMYRNYLWHYKYKLAFDKYDDDAVVFVSDQGIPFPFDADHVPIIGGTGGTGISVGSGTEAGLVASVSVPTSTTIVEVLHYEYTCPAVRLEYSIDETPGQNAVQLQFRVGTLDMSVPYEFNLTAEPADELVRGFLPGSHAVSRIYTQAGFIITGSETPAADPAEFKVYKGGTLSIPINGLTELFNELEIMQRDNQVWIWWNKLLIPPDPILSAALATPVVINTPYFTIPSPAVTGKIALRMWPGAVVRGLEVRDQAIKFSEFTYGQLELTTGV